jgi:hypothetical protein
MNKHRWLAWAELVDSYRLFPRIIVVSWGYFTALLCYQTLHWYFAEPATARGLEESGFATGVVTALTGFWYKIYQDYTAKGRNWNEAPNPTIPTLPPKDQ